MKKVCRKYEELKVFPAFSFSEAIIMFLGLLLNDGERLPYRGFAVSSFDWIDPGFYSQEQRQELSVMVVLWRNDVYRSVASFPLDKTGQPRGQTRVGGNEEMFLLC